MRLCRFANAPVGHMLALQLNQLTVVCFPSLPSNGVAGLEPPPPHLPTPRIWQSFKTSAGMSMCMLCQWQRAKRESLLREGGAAAERKDGWRIEREENGGGGGGCWAEMSIIWQIVLPCLLGLSVLWEVLCGCVHKRANIPLLLFPDKGKFVDRTYDH